MKHPTHPIRWIIEFHGDTPVFSENLQEEDRRGSLVFPNGEHAAKKRADPNLAVEKMTKETLEKLRQAYRESLEDLQKRLEYKEHLPKDEAVAESFEDLYALIFEVIRFMKLFKSRKNQPPENHTH
ncbi:MAG: hypothetical protein WB791_07300 [Waddliaceae bacterium]